MFFAVNARKMKFLEFVRNLISVNIMSLLVLAAVKRWIRQSRSVLQNSGGGGADNCFTDAPTSSLAVIYTPEGQFSEYLFSRKTRIW